VNDHKIGRKTSSTRHSHHHGCTRREIHTFADINAIEKIGKSQRGDELVVCNAIVTERERALW
jgi:hypothetical protein